MSQDGWPPPTTPTPPPAPPSSGPPTTPLSAPPVTGPPTVPYSTPPPAVQESENRGRGLVIGAIVALLALAGVVVFLLTRDGDDDAASVSEATIPAAAEEPTGLGDDEGFNALAEDCHDGEMAACDELYNRAEDDSAYRRYGDTCAGRQPENTRQFCTAAFPDG